MRLSPVLVIAAVCFARGASAQHLQREHFGDRVWRDTCAGTVRTRHGAWERGRPSWLYPRAWFSVGDPVYGDLDGDGVDEAIVPTTCGGGGTGVFSNATLFALRRGRWAEVTRLGEGDRAAGGLDDVRIEHGVIIERRRITEHGSADYEYVSERRRELRDGALREIAPATLECDLDAWPECVSPTNRAPEMSFGDDRDSVVRIVTFDRAARLPTLLLDVPPSSELAVDAWCIGTEVSRVSVASGTGAVFDARDAFGSVVVRPASGTYRITVDATRAVGLCMVMCTRDQRAAPR